MRIEGRIEVGPYGGISKSAREHQAFLVTADGERLLLRRYDGPSMRDAVLEELAGQSVVADGLRRGNLFIAKAVTAGDSADTPSSETAGAAPRRKPPRAR